MKRTLNKIAALIVAVVAFFFFPLSLFSAGAPELTSPAQQSVELVQNPAKYVFLFIGDGMSMTQITTAEAYVNALATTDVGISRLGFSQFPIAGLTTTHDAGSLITDSASAGTAIATGFKTLSGVINMDVSKTKSLKTISEYAKEHGMGVGIVSSVSIDHATPASFYAKVPSRGNMYDIAVQLTQSGFDYFGGGGFSQVTGKNKDKTSVLSLAKDAGYVYVNDKQAFEALTPGVGKVIAVNSVLQDSYAIPYDIDRAENDLSLADYTAKGIELLSANPSGFFLMVESGKIDWAGHANDAGASIHDTLAFDAAIAEAVSFAKAHPQDTLIVVTGDHETGGMTIGFAGTQYSTFFTKIAPQTMSFTKFNMQVLGPYKAALKASGGKGSLEDLLPTIKSSLGLDYDTLTALQKEQMQVAFQRSMGNEVIRPVEEDQYLLYGGYEPLTVKITQLLNQQAGIGWTSYSHTGVPVATFAMGVNQEMFGGYYDNTDIFHKLTTAMGIKISASN